MSENKYKLTLDKPATYEIKVPGHVDYKWSNWSADLTVSYGSNRDGLQITILTCTIDQAALLGLLRRFYSLGIPLESVTHIE